MRDEREDFGEINLGHGYRLVRRDALDEARAIAAGLKAAAEEAQAALG